LGRPGDSVSAGAAWGQVLSIAPAPPGGATAFTLNPAANLPASTTCEVTVAGTLLVDLAGTQLGPSVDFSFTTVGPPPASSTVPVYGAYSAPASATTIIALDRAVNVITGSGASARKPIQRRSSKGARK